MVVIVAYWRVTALLYIWACRYIGEGAETFKKTIGLNSVRSICEKSTTKSYACGTSMKKLLVAFDTFVKISQKCFVASPCLQLVFGALKSFLLPPTDGY